MTEVLFIKIVRGRYKIIIVTPYGALTMKQKETALFFGLAYDEKHDACHVPNIRLKHRIAKSKGFMEVKEL